MEFIHWVQPKLIIAKEGKHIRGIDDVYVPEHTDEEGNLVPEHIPHYATTIFVPNSFTKEQMNELYVEEEIDIEEVQKNDK